MMRLTRTRTPLRAAFLALFALSAATACGGDDGETTETSASTGEDSDTGEPDPEEVDEDGDGVFATADCDDGDAAVGEAVMFIGSKTFSGADAVADMEDFCAGYSGVDGDLLVEQSTSTELAELGCLCHVTGAITINENPELTTLRGLKALALSPQSLDITSNPQLADLRGLEALTELERLSVLWSRALVDFTGLSGVRRISNLDVRYNDELRSFAGLDSLRELSNFAGVIDNPKLESVAGLGGMQDGIIGGLEIRGAESLTALTGLDSLTVLAGELKLSENPALADISALHGVTQVMSDLTITDNDALPTASANALTDAIGEENIEGTITISGNAP